MVRAKPDDASILSAIAWAAKALWGYPSHWMEQWREQLTITPEFIARHDTFIGLLEQQPVGFHALVERQDAINLEHLWVAPEKIRQGIGRALFQHAVQQATVRQAVRLTIEADPHAEPFYLRMGARRVGVIVSELDGERRELPVLEFDLT
ncbi:MAG TPA: GNAT family N-acetyltransferase [Chthoniobacterales bacterium]